MPRSALPKRRASTTPCSSHAQRVATSRVPRKIMASNANRRKTVKKRRPNGGGRLDELLTVHAVGDSRPETLVGRYSGSVTPVSTIAAKTVPHPKRPKTAAKTPLGTRLARLYDPQGHPQGQPRLVGYARVSTDEQTTALQLDALRAAGCVAIYEHSASGASQSQPGLSRALDDLRPGDTIVVWRLDRLGRSLRDLLDISETLRERDVALRSLTDHIGRPPALSPVQVREAKKMLERGESPGHFARVLRVGRSTLYRALTT